MSGPFSTVLLPFTIHLMDGRSSPFSNDFVVATLYKKNLPRVAAIAPWFLSAPTILRPRVHIPSTPSMLFSICVEIVMKKEQK